MYQFRRIGLPPSVDGIKNIFRIDCETTLVGRGKSVDIFLDSNIRKGLISRAHAQIIQRNRNEKIVYELFDTSLNGTYVNDYKVKGSQVLEEGDIVAFGHLQGSTLEPGSKAPQKETEFLFKFERCSAVKEEVMVDLTEKISHQNDESSVFMSPHSQNGFDHMCLPGVAKGLESPSRKKVRMEKEKGNDDEELTSIVSSVTTKIKSSIDEANDSFEFDLDGESHKELSESVFPTKPIHPRDKLLSSTIPYPNSPSSFTSSDSEIKRDTSLNIKHTDSKKDNKSNNNNNNNTENNDYNNKSNRKKKTVSKLKKVFDDHKKGKKIQYDVVSTESESQEESEATVTSDIKVSSDSEYSEKSEEITDSSSSDSDFIPDAIPAINATRTRKIKSPVKLQINQPLSKKKNIMYIHDKCAAWDCKRPSGAVKSITWVQCDDCDDWFHVSCSGLNPKEAKRQDTNFHCGC